MMKWYKERFVYRYYFLSYTFVQGGRDGQGHCVARFNKPTTLNGIHAELLTSNNLTQVTINFLLPLSRKKYKELLT